MNTVDWLLAAWAGLSAGEGRRRPVLEVLKKSEVAGKQSSRQRAAPAQQYGYQ